MKSKTSADDVYEIIYEMVGYGEDVKDIGYVGDELVIAFNDRTKFKITVTEIKGGR